MIFHEDRLPADDSHEISCLIWYFWKSSKIWKCPLLQIIGGALRVNAYFCFLFKRDTKLLQWSKTTIEILPVNFSSKWGLTLGGRTPYITSQNRLHMSKLHIKDVLRTSENFLVRPKLDIETSCLQKKPAYIYQITWYMSCLHIGNSFILFIDHARTSHLTDFEFYWQPVSRVGFSRKRNY